MGVSVFLLVLASAFDVAVSYSGRLVTEGSRLGAHTAVSGPDTAEHRLQRTTNFSDSTHPADQFGHLRPQSLAAHVRSDCVNCTNAASHSWAQVLTAHQIQVRGTGTTVLLVLIGGVGLVMVCLLWHNDWNAKAAQEESKMMARQGANRGARTAERAAHYVEKRSRPANGGAWPPPKQAAPAMAAAPFLESDASLGPSDMPYGDPSQTTPYAGPRETVGSTAASLPGYTPTPPGSAFSAFTSRRMKGAPCC